MGWPCCLTHCKSARPSLSHSYSLTHLNISCLNKFSTVNFTSSEGGTALCESGCLCCVVSIQRQIDSECSAGLGLSLTRCSFIRQPVFSVTTCSFYEGVCSSVHCCPLPLCLGLWFPAAVRLCSARGWVPTCLSTSAQTPKLKSCTQFKQSIVVFVKLSSWWSCKKYKSKYKCFF